MKRVAMALPLRPILIDGHEEVIAATQGGKVLIFDM